MPREVSLLQRPMRWRRISGNSLEGWFGTTLLNKAGEANGTMQAMTVIQTQMAGASSVHAITRYRDVRIYEYTNNGKRAWMVWSATNKDITMNLPDLPASVIDVFGNPVTAAKRLVVNAKPLYVQW